MLVDLTLFGAVDKVADSIALLKDFEPAGGYYVAFSGGKDSVVIADLCRRAGVRHELHCSLTGLEPPQVIEFISANFDDVTFHKPAADIWQLMEKKLFPHTKKIRYCSSELKSRDGVDRVKVTGIRRDESPRRRLRQAVEITDGGALINPILDWTESDIWEYIRSENLPYCKLYDDGFKRIGCVFCPYQGKAEKQRHLRAFPDFADRFKAMFDWIVTERRRRGKPFAKFANGDDMWRWWINL